MSHNPNEIKSEIEKHILEAQKEGFNLCLKMLEDIHEKISITSITDNQTIDHCIIKFFGEIIKNVKIMRDEVYNDKVAE